MSTHRSHHADHRPPADCNASPSIGGVEPQYSEWVNRADQRRFRCLSAPLSDPHGDINLSLGIRDPQYTVGSPAFGVPKPTLYILDRRGVIRLRYQDPTYRTRPNLDGVLQDIEAAGL
jgi:hypothetical protein